MFTAATHDLTALGENLNRKIRREISERSMTDAELEKFARAKQAVQQDVTPPPSQAMRLRWVLGHGISEMTWARNKRQGLSC